MRAIWKYAVMAQDEPYEILMPKGAKVLCVGMPRTMDAVWLWAYVDDANEKEPRLFKVYGTGHPINPEHEYVGTAYTAGLPLVWHLFEVKESVEVSK